MIWMTTLYTNKKTKLHVMGWCIGQEKKLHFGEELDKGADIGM